MSYVQQCLVKKYAETYWRYHGVNKLLYELRDKATNEELRDEIRELRKLGLIDIVSGINGYLIEIKNVSELYIKTNETI